MLPALKILGAAALMVPLPQIAQAQGGPGQAQGGWQAATQRTALQREIADKSGKDLRAFYAARQHQPLWLTNSAGRRARPRC
jgi:hypothetical protein